MTVSTVPTSVLSQQVQDVIDGRRVRCAVFTTFSFDPAFFELHILPLLFDQSFRQPEKVRRIQLDDALRAVDNIAVYYDMRALAQDGGPAQLDYRRIDISRGTGYFHPKVILLLVDDATHEDRLRGDDAEPDEGSIQQALLVGILSANLTRSGWWENVECAHIEEVKDKANGNQRSSVRPTIRMAEGPMSTPRRPAPRSRDAPMIWTERMVLDGARSGQKSATSSLFQM